MCLLFFNINCASYFITVITELWSERFQQKAMCICTLPFLDVLLECVQHAFEFRFHRYGSQIPIELINDTHSGFFHTSHGPSNLQ
jgi:hypothetical protein